MTIDWRSVLTTILPTSGGMAASGGAMCRILHSLASLDWVAVSAVFVAIVALRVAVKTLKDAEDFWKQQKWFDLYAKADEAYDTFDKYRKKYKHLMPNPEQNPDHF